MCNVAFFCNFCNSKLSFVCPLHSRFTAPITSPQPHLAYTRWWFLLLQERFERPGALLQLLREMAEIGGGHKGSKQEGRLMKIYVLLLGK